MLHAFLTIIKAEMKVETVPSDQWHNLGVISFVELNLELKIAVLKAKLKKGGKGLSINREGWKHRFYFYLIPCLLIQCRCTCHNSMCKCLSSTITETILTILYKGGGGGNGM